MKSNSLDCLLEAYRRWINDIGGSNPNTPLGEKWLGLGTKTTYKSALDDGVMQWVYGTPHPRTMGWLKLTTTGELWMKAFTSKGISKEDFNNFDFTGWDKLGDWKQIPDWEEI